MSRIGAIGNSPVMQDSIKSIKIDNQAQSRQINNQIEQKKQPVQSDAEKLLSKEGDRVIGRSQDGDTAVASRDGRESQKAGIVTKKQEKAEEKSPFGVPNVELQQPAASAGSDDKNVNVSSAQMRTITSDQLERYHREGVISQNEYDNEVNRRNDQKEELTGDGEKSIAEEALEMNNSHDVKNETEQKSFADQAKEAFSTSVQDTNDLARKESAVGAQEGSESADKMSASSVENDDKAAEEKKQVISDQIENSQQFIGEMGAIAQQQQDFSLKADAYQNAIEADRVDLMNRITEESRTVQAVTNN